MENNIKNKKRKLKPFVKVILVLIFLRIIFFILYKSNFISSAKTFFQNSYTNVKSSIKNIIPHKDSSVSESSDDTNNDFVSVFKKRLSSQNVEFASSTLLPNGDIKIFLKNTKDEAGYLYVNTKNNVEEVWSTFASIAIADPVKNLLNTNLTNLNYIDLRFKNKVFYKFNNLTNTSSSSISTSSVLTNSTSSISISATCSATTSPTTNTN